MTTFLALTLPVLIQSSALLSLGRLALWLSRGHGPAMQTLIGRATLVGIALTLLLSAPLAGRVRPLWRVSLPTASPLAPNAGGARGAITQTPSAPVPALSAPVLPSPPPPLLRAGEPSPLPPPQTAPISVPQTPRLYAALATLWAVGTATLLLWLCVCRWHLTRLRREARTLTSGPATELLAALTPCPPLLLTYPAVSSPFLAGTRRPAIYLPTSHATDFTSDALRAILAHEMAHLSRRDCAWTLASCLLCAILWPQPLLWLLCRRLEQIGEEACDATVLAQNCPPRAYADCLLSLAERHPLSRRERAIGAGVAPFRSSLGQRIGLILSTGTHTMSRVSPRLRLTIAALTLAAALGGAFLVSSAPAQTTAPAPPVLTPQEQGYSKAYKQDIQNLKEIGVATYLYERNHHYRRFPDANHWMDQIAPYLEDTSALYDPFQLGQKHYGYAYNRNCSSKPLSAAEAPAETVMFFDSTLGMRNASDAGQSLRINPRPTERFQYAGSGYGFVDGHAKWIPQGFRPTFSLEGEPSLFGTWVNTDPASPETVMVFSPSGIVEQVGPWLGDTHKIGHTYGRYNERETTLEYIFTRVWVEGKPMYTVPPEKHILDYTRSGDVLTIRSKAKGINVYHRSHTYTVHKPKGFLWI